MMSIYDKGNSSIAYYVHRRTGHTLVAFEGRLYLWGGYMEKPSVNYVYHSSCDVWTYQPLTDIWTRRVTRGDVPPKLSGACATVHDDHMYIFGGFHDYGGDEEIGNTNMLWRLNLRTLTWKLINPRGDLPFPVDKSTCWTYNDRIYIFGGFGPRISHYHPKKTYVSFVRSEINNFSSRGWIGQLAYYDIQKNEWIWPRSRNPPSPRASHASIITGDYAYIFGGRHLNYRLNDLYRIHLPTHTWTSNLNKNNDELPQGRSWHTFTLLSQNRAFLYGGYNSQCEVLDDCWELNINEVNWNKLPWFKMTARAWHTAAALKPGEVSILGGLSNNILDYTIPKNHAEEFVTIRFTPASLKKISIDTLLGADPKYRESWVYLPKLLQDILNIRSSLNKYISY